MKINKYISISAIVIMLIVFLANVSQNEIKYIKNTFNPLPQTIKSPTLKTSYLFAGEKIPVGNPDIVERLDRELLVNSYYHSSTIQNIKLANKYFPAIEKILKKNNIPQDFKYLAIAESGLRNVVSPAGATGFWQLMKPIGKELNLEIYEEVDERYDLQKSTEAACKYLNKLKAEYGSWINATAAYNLGPTKFSQALEREGESNYFNLNLNSETMRYVFRIVALKEIIENPENYGFHINQNEKYGPLDNYYTIKIENSIQNLGDYAHKYGISYRELKRYNPWLRSHKLTVKNKQYLIKIPKN